jgi:hypothetical protein
MAKRITKITNPMQIFQAIFGDSAGVVRASESGLDWTPKGAAGTAIRVDQGTPCLCFNSSGSVQFVAFGDQTVAAPSSASNGIPILAGQTFIVNSGEKEWIRASAASVFVFTGDV